MAELGNSHYDNRDYLIHMLPSTTCQPHKLPSLARNVAYHTIVRQPLDQDSFFVFPRPPFNWKLSVSLQIMEILDMIIRSRPN